METKEFFREVYLFKQLTELRLEWLSDMAVERASPEGTIIKDNDELGGLGILKSGMVNVTKSAADNEGLEAVLAVLRQGNSFCEIGFIDGLPRSANEVAMESSVCYFLPQDAFR